MTEKTDIAPLSPFSVRNRRDLAPIDNDFPESARIALLHLIDDAIEKRIISSWAPVTKELQRIARVPRKEYGANLRSTVAEQNLACLEWDRAYDFCERLHGYLVERAEYQDSDGNSVVVITKDEAQQFIADELQRLFQEENLAYEFRDGAVQRRGRRHTVDRVSKAEAVLADAKLDTARQHFAKAQRYFRDRVKPDPENAVKEAVCAVEAAAKELFPSAKATTLGDSIKWLTGPEPGKLPKAIGQTLTGLYAFRNGGEGVAHGGATGGTATAAIAEYVLSAAASQIILLVDLAGATEDDIPF